MKIGFLLPTTLLATGITLISSFFAPAFAVPNLQLDITGGQYDNSDESVFTTTPIFDLLAYCKNSNQNPCLTDTYYVSIAVLTDDGNAVSTGTDFGSFSFGLAGGPAITYSSANMTFGGPAGLPTHGVYETMFAESDGFQFLSNFKRDEVDVEPNPGTAPVDTTDIKKDLYYRTFNVDFSGLTEGYRLHFDLYSKDAQGQADIKAPFSHDAYAQNPSKDVPEPSALLGLGLLAGAFSMKRGRKAQVG